MFSYSLYHITWGCAWVRLYLQKPVHSAKLSSVTQGKLYYYFRYFKPLVNSHLSSNHFSSYFHIPSATRLGHIIPRNSIVQIYSGITSGRVLVWELLYTKLLEVNYLHLPTYCFMKISLQSTGLCLIHNLFPAFYTINSWRFLSNLRGYAWYLTLFQLYIH